MFTPAKTIEAYKEYLTRAEYTEKRKLLSNPPEGYQYTNWSEVTVDTPFACPKVRRVRVPRDN
jgi:hypothetical protein